MTCLRCSDCLCQYLEDIELLLSAGESVTQIAGTIGRPIPSLARQLYRLGRNDLAKPFAREDMRIRSAVS